MSDSHVIGAAEAQHIVVVLKCLLDAKAGVRLDQGSAQGVPGVHVVARPRNAIEVSDAGVEQITRERSDFGLGLVKCLLRLFDLIANALVSWSVGGLVRRAAVADSLASAAKLQVRALVALGASLWSKRSDVLRATSFVQIPRWQHDGRSSPIELWSL